MIYRTICNFLIKHPRIVDLLLNHAKKTPYFHIKGDDGTDYMRRWWLFNPYDEQTRKRRYPFVPFSIRFHEIMREDRDRHLHDHPWNAVSLIIRGSYDELIEASPRMDFIRINAPGSVNRIGYGKFHKIKKIHGPVLSLFITFKYQGTWGFNVNGKKIPWREYLNKYSKEK